MGRECVIANQLRCTSKSVDRLNIQNKIQIQIPPCMSGSGMNTYYAGNRSSLRHVERNKVSHSVLLTSASHPIGLILRHQLVFALAISSPGVVADSTRTGASLNVARLCIELADADDLSVCIAEVE
jgi:hypothetical protein